MPVPTVPFGLTPPALGDDPAVFNQRFDALLNYLPDYTADLNDFSAALVAAAAVANYSASSTSNVAIGTGARTFTIETGKMFVVGQSVIAASAAAPTVDWMFGIVTSHNSETGSLQVTVSEASGGGSHADWSIALQGLKGNTGPVAGGTLMAANNLADVSNASTALGNLGGQAQLASGTNIKTVNGSSLLGAGNLLVGAAWTQIANTATTSGSSKTFSSIPQTYNDLMLVLAGVSASATHDLQIELSDNGTNWTTVKAMSKVGGVAATDTHYGIISIPAYRRVAGGILANIINLTANLTAESSITRAIAWRIAAGIAHIRVSVSAGNFDAGTIYLYGI